MKCISNKKKETIDIIIRNVAFIIKLFLGFLWKKLNSYLKIQLCVCAAEGSSEDGVLPRADLRSLLAASPSESHPEENYI